MNEKKIYKLLKQWFLELSEREIPSKKHILKFKYFVEFLSHERIGHRYRGYLMKIDPDSYLDNGLEYSASFYDHQIHTDPIQAKIREQATSLFEHYQKYQSVIGQYYNVYQQIYDLTINEISKVAQQCGAELLLIYAETYYWMIVPSDEKMIQKFCQNFNKQFQNDGVSIEHYFPSECLKST